MKVLIAGGDGYIGAVLARTLHHQVSIFDITRGMDITDCDSWARACEGMETVIYLLGITNNDQCEKNPDLARAINQTCFPSVIDIAHEKGVRRFIYASSVAAYGSSEEEMDETHPLNPSTLYGIGKVASELALELSDIPYVITRSASVCGWSPRMRNDLTVNKMVHDATTKHLITVNGGAQYRCHVRIQDLCEFYELLLKAPEEKVRGEVFNVMDRNDSIKHTAQLVASIVGTTVVEFGPATDNRSYKASGKKASDVLGWQTKRPYTDAVHDIIHGQSSL